MSESNSWMDTRKRLRSLGLDVSRPWQRIDRVKIALVAFVITAAALVLFFICLSIATSGARDDIETLLRATEEQLKQNTERSLEANSSVMTIFDELTISNYTDVMMTTVDPGEKAEEVRNSSVAPQADGLRSFFVLDGEKKRGQPEGLEDFAEDSVYSGRRRIMNRVPSHGFTQGPLFTEPYAQLEPYKRPTSMRELLRYLKRVKNGGLSFRFSGMYVRAPHEPLQPRPFNGHAYVADPFAEFKPDDLSDINSLAGSTPPHRFSRPPPPRAVPRPELDSESPVLLQTSPEYPTTLPTYDDLQSSATRPRPFSVMLDIFPVSPKQEEETMATDVYTPRESSTDSIRTVRDRGSRMVLHLNLYPKKNMRRRPTITQSVLPEEVIQERSFGDEEDSDIIRPSVVHTHNCTTRSTATIKAPIPSTTPLTPPEDPEFTEE